MESEDQKAIARNEYKKAVFSTGKRNHNGYFFQSIYLILDCLSTQLLLNIIQMTRVRFSCKKMRNPRYRYQMILIFQVRGYLRATNLDARSNCGYDLLTGIVI
jgi:hypothetical protein